jgi:alkylhydroperoxidase/carboxymuconolactone decarboxylase family protein YurZ
MADDGERVRREVLGDEHVDKTLGGASEYGAPFQEYLTRVAWGEVWARPGLDRRTRSCLTLALLTALRAEGELPMHVRAAIGNGVTPGSTPASRPGTRRSSSRSRRSARTASCRRTSTAQ